MDSEKGNFIKINRSILEWEWYQDTNTKCLFLHLLLKANWKDARWKGYEVKRGSFITSIGTLASETGLTVNQVRTALAHLQKTGEITSKTTSKFTLITIEKYGVFQDVRVDEPQAKSQTNHKQITNKSQSNHNQITTIEEEKDMEEEKESSIAGVCTRFKEFWNSYPKQTHRMLAEQAYSALVSSGITEDDLTIAARNYAEYCQIKRTQQEFISHPDNWLNKSKWTDYTVENYKKPIPVNNSNNKFNDFQQRSYDMAALEKQLLSYRSNG